MLCPCIQTLERVISGQLRFGSMPPLGGVHEPIGRLVPVGAPIEKGDVVLDCEFNDWEAASPAFCPEEAFMRGALGVVSRRRVTTWDGCFSIQSSLAPARQLANWVRSQHVRPVVAVVDEDGDSRLGESIRLRAMRPIDLPFVEWLEPTNPMATTAGRSAWRWLNWRMFNQPFVGLAPRTPDGEMLLKLLQPDIVVFRGLGDPCDNADVELCRRMGTPFRIGESGDVTNEELEQAALSAIDEVDASLSALQVASA